MIIAVTLDLKLKREDLPLMILMKKMKEGRRDQKSKKMISLLFCLPSN